MEENLDFKKLEGLTVADATTSIEDPYYIHISKLDGKGMLITANVDFHRIRVEVEKGIITKVLGRG